MLRLISQPDHSPAELRRQERSRGLRHAGRYAFSARAATIAVSFVATPLIARGLGTATFGIFSTITLLATYIALSDLGVGNALLTRLGAIDPGKQPDERRQLVTSALAVLVGSSVAVAAVGIALGLLLPIGRLLGAPPEQYAAATQSFVVFVLVTAMTLPLALGARIQGALQQSSTAAVWSAAGVTSGAVLSAATATVTGSLPLTMPCSMLCVAAAQGVQSARTLREHPDCRPGWRFLSRSRTRSLTSTSGWLLLIQLSVVLAFQSDLLVVSAVLGSSQAGSYSIALRVFALVSLLTTTFMVPFWPAAAEALASGDGRWVRREHRRLSARGLATAFVASAVLVVVGPGLCAWWVGPSLAPPRSLLFAMACWTTYYVAFVPTAYLLNAAHVLRPQAVLAVAMATVNLLLSLALTRWIGLSGPVWGSLLAHVTVFGLPSLWLARRLLLAPAGPSTHSGGPPAVGHPALETSSAANGQLGAA